MKRFIEGDARGQATLLPELLDDYVAENNSVRVVDVFVDELDLAKLGFEVCSQQKQDGQLITPPCCSSSTFTATSTVFNQAVASSAKPSVMSN